MKRVAALAIAAMMTLAGCGSSSSKAAGDEKIPKGCNSIDVASSPEKLDLLTKLGQAFNKTKEAKSGDCAFVRVKKVASGGGAQALVSGWSAANVGPEPVIWSPAASTWGGVVNQRLADKGQPAIVPTDFKSMQLTPLVIAMPKPMADALGYPKTPIGFADIAALAADPNGWAAKGHPEWGAFKLGRTNPNFSTSGLNNGIATYYAATGKTSDLTVEDLNQPQVKEFTKKLESSVVHYGDTTLTFLNNMYRADRTGASLSYVSAVAVEEKSVIDYNNGNPDGILDAGEQPRPPRVPLVAIYPKEGTLFSDSPLFILDAPWVTAQQKAGAKKFQDFVLREDNQREVLKSGFRPGNSQVAIGEPIGPATGTDASQPQATLVVPSAKVVSATIDQWGLDRKAARVLMVIDVSGSMGDDAGGGSTKLDLAKQAAIDALTQFGPEDEVGLRTFSTGVGPPEHSDWLDLVPIGSITAQRETMVRKLQSLEPEQGTPLFTATRDAYNDMTTGLDKSRINAVLVLTDGKNEDPRNSDLTGTLTALQSGSEGLNTPVRVFTIGYGKDADQGTLKRIAESTNAAAYDASNPNTIGQVFTTVVSNF